MTNLLNELLEICDEETLFKLVTKTSDTQDYLERFALVMQVNPSEHLQKRLNSRLIKKLKAEPEIIKTVLEFWDKNFSPRTKDLTELLAVEHAKEAIKEFFKKNLDTSASSALTQLYFDYAAGDDQALSRVASLLALSAKEKIKSREAYKSICYEDAILDPSERKKAFLAQCNVTLSALVDHCLGLKATSASYTLMLKKLNENFDLLSLKKDANLIKLVNRTLMQNRNKAYSKAAYAISLGNSIIVEGGTIEKLQKNNLHFYYQLLSEAGYSVEQSAVIVEAVTGARIEEVLAQDTNKRTPEEQTMCEIIKARIEQHLLGTQIKAESGAKKFKI